VLAKPIIDIMAAPEYYIGYQIVPLVASGAFLVGLAQRFQGPLTYVKRTDVVMVCTIIPACLNIVLNLLFVPSYGYKAAALTTFICYFLFFSLMVLTSRKFLTWEFPFTSLARVACASAIMGLGVYPIGNSLTSSALINLLVAIPTGIAIYFVLLVALREFKANELEALLAWWRGGTKY